MTLTMSGNVFVGFNGRLFDIGTNLIPKFEIGIEEGDDAWLKGEFAGPNNDEPIFNGRLYLPSADAKAVIIDNFPKADAPDGWTKCVSLNHDGFDLVSADGVVIFGYIDDGQGHVRVTTSLYGAGGQLVARADSGSLQVFGLSMRV